MESRIDAVAFATWSHPEAPFPVQYSLAAFHEIDFLVSEGFRRIPYGGVEHGGLLFGKQENGTLQIEAFRQIDCEHAYGPSFSLSERDVDATNLLLASFRSDPQLAELNPLGLFISHSRRELQVSGREQEWLHLFFPAPPHVLLLVKPEKFKPTRFVFGVTEGESLIETDLTSRSFILPLPGRAERKQRAAPEPVPEPPELSVPVSEPQAVQEPAKKLREPKSRRQRSRRAELNEPIPELLPPVDTPIPRPEESVSHAAKAKHIAVKPALAAFAAAALLCLAVCFTWFDWTYLQPPIQLHATPVQGRLVVEWSSGETAGASQAQLRISDGNATSRISELSTVEKNSGRSSAALSGRDVTIELSVRHWLHDRRGIVRVIY